MIKVLHFADAHIDMANYGRHDPQTGLPLRVLDFLKSLDAIVDSAIAEKVDLVLFAGDAYKDRSPAPTFQREWGRRVMRLSRAGIPTLLLVGNHDLSPALGRAHALDSFDTLEVPHVRVVDRPCLLTPADLEGLPLQVICLPWVSRSGLMAQLGLSGAETGEVFEQIEERLTRLVHEWIEQADPNLPVILAAHCSVQGALYGSERTVMLGGDLVLPRSLVCDPRLDYVALGHIHKHQDLNEGSYPPVVYSGSIERVDFGEANDEKGYAIAEVERGQTRYEWRRLEGTRPFIDRYLRLESPDNISQQLREALPGKKKLKDAVVRLVLEYPQEWEAAIDDASMREYTAGCFEFHLVKRPQVAGRVRIPEDQTIGSLSPIQLLEIYWRANHVEEGEIAALSSLAVQLLGERQV
jgi:exonuclease SbcD